MHYIIGTYFVTPQRLGTSENDRKLQPRAQYSIIYIQKQEDGVIYTLADNARQKIDLKFNSCREADNFIAKYRKENVPDYEASYAESLDSES